MKWLRRLKTLATRRRVDDEIQRELAFHLEMESAERERRGLEPAHAKRAAAIDFGGLAATREHVRDARGLTFLETLIQDIRFGLRLLRRQPMFTAVAVLVLALGIGANTAVFSIVNVLLLKPRAWHVNGEVVGVYSKDTSEPDTFRGFSYPEYVDLRARTDAFEAVTAHNFALVGLNEGQTTRRVIADVITADFFELFGSLPIAGRPFTADEERPGADIPVVIISYNAWQRVGGRADILGTSLRLNSREFTIVGVAARGFGGSMAFATPDVWLPTGVYDSVTNDFFREGLAGRLADRAHRALLIMARLRPGVTAASLDLALNAISRQMADAYPIDSAHQALILAPLARMSLSTRPVSDGPAVAGVSAALLSMAAVVLVVASLNLANMLLARSGARRQEFAIRLAIGGSRRRLVRQLMTEGLILAGLGGVVGLFVSSWATRLLVATLTPLSPVSFAFDPMPDFRILAAMVAYCAVSAVVFAVLPARRLARMDPSYGLKGHSGELPVARSRFAVSGILVMGQLALSLVLITVGALFTRGATEAAKADPGFTFDRGVLIQVDPSLAGYPAVRAREFYRAALDTLRARPDVAAASVSSLMPFGELEDDQMVQRAGKPIRPGDPDADANLVKSTFTGVGTGYFGALGLSVLAGRDFTTGDEWSAAGPAQVAIIDVPLARKLFGGESAIGQRVQYQPRDPNAAPVLMTVVGVAPGIRQNFFDYEPGPHLYVPFGNAFTSGSYLQIRTRATSAEAEAVMLPGFREVLKRIDSRVPILTLETRSAYRDRNLMLGVVRAGAAIFTVLGVVALFVAAVGVYGVKAYLVSRRTREIGIRMALGASPARVVWMVIRDGLVASVIGLGLGLALSAVVGQGMRALTYQGRAADAAMLGLALLVLTSAALFASWIPARRATRIAPTRALRE